MLAHEQVNCSDDSATIGLCGKNYWKIYTCKRIETAAAPCTAHKPFNLGEQKKK